MGEVNITLSMLVLLSAVFFFKEFSKKLFQEYHQNVQQFVSRSGPTFVGPDLGPFCLKGYQQTTLADRYKLLAKFGFQRERLSELCSFQSGT